MDAVLLSESELRSALEPLLDRLLAERLRYFQLEMEPRLRAMVSAVLREDGAGGTPGGLEQMLQCQEADQALDVLFERTAGLAARAVLVVYQGQAVVWRSTGLELPARLEVPSSASALCANPDRVAEMLPIRAGGATLGLLYWEEERKVSGRRRSHLEMLARAAGLALLEFALEAARAEASDRPIANAGEAC